MNRRTLYIAAILLPLFLLQACEQTVDISDLPQQEDKLVVFGGLTVTPDSVFTSFWFQRTGTLAEHYRPEDHVVTDVDFSLRTDNEDISLQEAGTYALENWRIDYRRTLASSLRSGATAGATDFDLTFFWKDKRIPVRVAAPAFPVQLGDVKLRKSLTDSATYLISYSYPIPKGKEEVHAEFWEYDSEKMEWDRCGSALIENWFNPEQTHGSIRVGTAHLRSKHEHVASSHPRFRYRLRIMDTYCGVVNAAYVRSDHGSPDIEHSPFDPPGVNPPFNVTGDGIGFVSYRRFGEWIEIPY